MILANFKHIGNFDLQTDSLQSAHFCCAKKLLLPFIAYAVILVACMAFELSNILISLSASVIVTLLKEKHSLVNYETIAITLGCFFT